MAAHSIYSGKQGRLARPVLTCPWPIRGFLLVCIAMLSLALTHGGKVWAGCYLDTPSGYQRMGGAGRLGPYPSSSSCEAVNARAFHGKGYCRCTTSGSSGGGGNNWRAEQLRREYLRKQREEERKRRLLQEADAENEQRRQAAQAEFMDKHTEATQKLKGARPDKLTLKSGTNFFNSNAQRHQGTMDYQKSLELSSKQLEIRATASEWKQIYCGMWIANYANPAAKDGDVAEVRFLKSQMMQCFKGGLVELRCPSAAEVPAIPGGVEIGATPRWPSFTKS